MHYVDRSRSALFHSRDKLPILWLLYFYFGDLTQPIDVPIHPPNHTPTYMLESHHRFQMFKLN